MTRWDDLTGSAPLDAGQVERAASALLAALTLDEKLACVAGESPTVHGLLADARRYNARPVVAGHVPRLGIPGIRFSDGPRGVVMGASTAFPVSIARGATFDADLEREVGDVIGVEARAQGANLFGGVCVNVLRHPAWGRSQETYGEDPYLLGEMGAALIEGSQRHVMACAKHFALNSIENSRFFVDVSVDDATLHDVYLPHFRRCVDAGVASIMSAYNKVNGQWCGHHQALLGDVLKRQWGFDGFVMSDFVLGVRSGPDALDGGQDLEMPYRFRFRSLARALRRRRITEARIDESVLRLLRQQLRFANVGRPESYHEGAVACDAHRRLARRVSDRACVLLQNEPCAPAGRPILPLVVPACRRAALIGRLASLPVTGDRGSSRVYPPGVVTLAEGIAEAGAAHGVEVAVYGAADLAAAARAAAAADVAVVVVGYTHRDEGEYLGWSGGDRRSLRLRPRDERLIETVSAANPRTVVVLVGGGAIVCEPWRRRAPAILMAWYPGMEGGRSVAGILFGDVNPSGRLPCTWARSGSQLPAFRRWARRAYYGPLFGYRWMVAEKHAPSWWFGHGIGYSPFRYGAARSTADADIVCEVTNTGNRAGDEVVQVYVDVALGSDPRPIPALCGFQRVSIAAGATAEVTIRPDPRLLEKAEAAGPVRLRVGPCAASSALRDVDRSESRPSGM